MYEGPIFVLRCEQLNKIYHDKQERRIRLPRQGCIPERVKGCVLEQRLPPGSFHNTGRVVLIYCSLVIVSVFWRDTRNRHGFSRTGEDPGHEEYDTNTLDSIATRQGNVINSKGSLERTT